MLEAPRDSKPFFIQSRSVHQTFTTRGQLDVRSEPEGAQQSHLSSRAEGAGGNQLDQRMVIWRP